MISQANNTSHSLESATSTTIPTSSACWHEDFLNMLPKIQDHASYHFRNLQGDNRDEVIQEVICNACLAFSRLVEQGRAEAATWSSLAKYAVAQVRAGRRVGSSLNVNDVASKHCQKRKGVNLRSIHDWDDQEQQWQEMLVEDKTATPADLAASRIDFPAWLETLSERDRRIALKLSEGESTSRVARLFRISAARVSQLRRDLLEAWNAFHGDLNLPMAEAAA